MEERKYEVPVLMKYTLTEEDIENLMCSALCGGIGYWAVLDNSTPEFERMPEDERIDTWTAKLLMDGETICFLDAEDHEVMWTLRMNMLLNGIRLYIEKGYDRWGAFSNGEVEMGQVDAEAADMIVQLALFGEILYG